MLRRNFIAAITAPLVAGVSMASREPEARLPGGRYFLRWTDPGWAPVPFDSIGAGDTCLMIDVADDGRIVVRLVHVQRRRGDMVEVDWCDDEVLDKARCWSEAGRRALQEHSQSGGLSSDQNSE